MLSCNVYHCAVLLMPFLGWTLWLSLLARTCGSGPLCTRCCIALSTVSRPRHSWCLHTVTHTVTHAVVCGAACLLLQLSYCVQASKRTSSTNAVSSTVRTGPHAADTLAHKWTPLWPPAVPYLLPALWAGEGSSDHVAVTLHPTITILSHPTPVFDWCHLDSLAAVYVLRVLG